MMAMMLGVRRSSVSEVLEPLQGGGLIRFERGRVTVLDRDGLEASACECYRTVNDEFQRLLD
jgi:Mn-dependent DtxR family transcriptional regulator